jgi:hypothetical protein
VQRFLLQRTSAGQTAAVGATVDDRRRRCAVSRDLDAVVEPQRDRACVRLRPRYELRSSRNAQGHGICSAPGPGEVARIPAGHASQLSSAHPIAPAHECSYEAAVFDAWGIAATEGCEKGTARDFKGFGEDRGDCYLVQLNSRGQVTARFPLRREPNPTTLTTTRSGALVLVSEQNGENTRPYWDWIWAFNGRLLRLVGHYDANVTAIP